MATGGADQQVMPIEGPRYFVIRHGRPPVSWVPPETTDAVGHEMAYWGRVLEAMEHSLVDRDLTFHLVWPGAGGPPWDGPDVVAVGVAAESWRDLARSAHRVRATFQVGGPDSRVPGSVRGPLVPALTALGLRGRSYLDKLRWKRGQLWTYLRGKYPRPVFAVPEGLGYPGSTTPIVKPIAERPIGLSFSGSMKSWQGWWGDFTAKMGSPKVRSRREMLRAVGRFQRSHPNVETEIRVAESYAISGSSDQTYWERLTNAKICLVPAGTRPITARHFEALRAGCAIVTDVSPEGWYASGAPFIELRSWDDLEAAVVPLLDDEAALEHRHRVALAWWKSHCSEEVVGRFMAARLNELAARAS